MNSAILEENQGPKQGNGVYKATSVARQAYFVRRVTKRRLKTHDQKKICSHIFHFKRLFIVDGTFGYGCVRSGRRLKDFL